MQPADFDYIAALLKKESGMHLAPEKTYLLESRLQPIARSHGHDSIGALLSSMRMSNDAKLVHEVTQAMTTNETMFFRDTKPFDLMKNTMVPTLFEQSPPKKHIRIWSAACSSGQEPYTIAITLLEAFANHPDFRFEIVATDLCDKALNTAKEGIYSQFEVQRGLPIQVLLKYFTQQEGNRWQVQDHLKKHIRFDTHNLLDDASYLGRFDIVFCRNVLIYFDPPTKSHVFSRIADVMNPPGFMSLGVAESTVGLCDRFKSHETERNLFMLA